jgi:ketosteroid isomerase-like protein
MAAPEEVIRRYVNATSAGDGDTAAALTADDVVIERPNGAVLKGKEGVRQFAAKHAETDGRKLAVRLTSLEARTRNRFVATLVMTNARSQRMSLSIRWTLDPFSRFARGSSRATRSFLRPTRLLPRRSRLNSELLRPATYRWRVRWPSRSVVTDV